MRKILLLFLLISVLIGCSSGKAVDKRAPVDPASVTIPADTLIIMERTGCYGTCPAYTLKIDAKGVVRYEGLRDVQIKGVEEGKISQDQLRLLIAKIESIDFFSLKDQYGKGGGCPSFWTDNPSAITSVRMNGKTKRIDHNYGCREETKKGVPERVFPNDLFELESKIDEITGSKQWL